jgi:hypothetical protein
VHRKKRDRRHEFVGGFFLQAIEIELKIGKREILLRPGGFLIAIQSK